MCVRLSVDNNTKWMLFVFPCPGSRIPFLPPTLFNYNNNTRVTINSRMLNNRLMFCFISLRCHTISAVVHDDDDDDEKLHALILCYLDGAAAAFMFMQKVWLILYTDNMHADTHIDLCCFDFNAT